TGALILTGVALRRRNARAIAELFAAEAGRFVAVSAGDNLEATMAAHGSGAAALSETHGAVMNVDIGGGTTKVAVCRGGRVTELMTIDIGARLVVLDESGVITRLEGPGRAITESVGLEVALGASIPQHAARTIVRAMVDELFGELRGGGASGGSRLLRTAPLRHRSEIRAVTFSGGVSEFIYGRADRTFGDMGALLAEEIRSRQAELGAPILETPAGIRATVIGASQYTIQLSGSTIFVSPLDVTPVRNVPVVMPLLSWDEFDASTVTEAIQDALRRLDLLDARVPVAIAAAWRGSATLGRIQAFCAGALAGMETHIRRGHPLILVFDGDIGGLLGLHVRDELALDIPIISIDGVDLREFDYIDIGTLIPSSGAVPVVIKALVFPTASDR
ncbi:MAG: ethanolamine ammonia-lyase reactivating factor EutA, partial [Dehalococcoidia bacterium]